MTRGWPDPDTFRRLPDNHRRALRSTLVAIANRLPALVEAGAVAADGEDVARLRALLDAIGPAPSHRNLDAVRVALLVQSEELAPEHMDRYGPLDPASRAALAALVDRLRIALAAPQKGS